MNKTTYTLYSNTDTPVVIEFSESVRKDKKIHAYKVVSPSQYASKKTGVTSVIGFKDKSGPLMQWAANLAVEAKNAGLSDKEAKYAHLKRKDEAAAIGTAVHDWIEAHLKGQKLPVTKEMKASVDGYLAWENENLPNLIASEQIVYSKEHDYCGKLDWRGWLGGRYGLIDFKTGSFDEEYNSYRKAKTGRIRAKTDHFIQNAGYDIPLFEEFGMEAEFYGVLYIPINGNVQYFETTHTDWAKQAFLHTLAAQRTWLEVERSNNYEMRSNDE